MLSRFRIGFRQNGEFVFSAVLSALLVVTILPMLLSPPAWLTITQAVIFGLVVIVSAVLFMTSLNRLAKERRDHG